MCLACPVWSKMLMGKLSESSLDTVEFPHDGPDAMEIVLRIAHLQFDKILDSGLSHVILAQMANLVETHDLYHLIKAFSCRWLEYFCDEITVNSPSIAWVFGEEKMFKDCFIDLVKATNKQDDERGITERCIRELSTPAGIGDVIMSVRGKAIDRILSIFHIAMQGIENDTAMQCVVEESRCYGHRISMITEPLRRLKLLPLPSEGEEISVSVNNVEAELADTMQYPESDEQHEDCYDDIYR
ncbi:hypothetical protein EJ05DRAFT_289104 [Pseudovirgaria hyperparasitica]|uniref:Uncharacterized protein n=1 Tax=Pseudovirgaria hyperparasitica TaxID=470096 RepID=A0A6A6WCK0_9PEZI|nr:uncharacterized protein EJ05DRAFT_289104 [Pseudovirgaria hyperparasitica]KAF2760562.1 hypothetical protein EJ05DRAFT_289104 [Pseudovirgaria hyperparasitica]